MDFAQNDNDIEVTPFPKDNLLVPMTHAELISKKREQKREHEVDKSMLADHTAALQQSVQVAIARLQKQMAQHPEADYGERMAEYQTIESNANAISEALRNPHVSVMALGRLESSLSSDLKLWEESDTKKQTDDKEREGYKASEAMVAEENKIEMEQRAINGNTMVVSLRTNQQTVNAILQDNSDLSNEAATTAREGSKDLIAAVAVAGMLYEAGRSGGSMDDAQAKIAKFLEEKSADMASAGYTAEASQDRVQHIMQAAQDIHSGTMQSTQEGGRRMLKAADEFVNNPIKAQMDTSSGHFAQAEAHLKKRVDAKLGRHARHHHDQFCHHREHWNQLRGDTMQHIDAQMTLAAAAVAGIAVGSDLNGKDFYARMQQDLGLDKIIAQAESYAHENSGILKKQAAIFKDIHDKGEDTDRQLTDLLTGKSRNVQIADELGMKPQQLRSEVLKFRVDNDLPIERDLFTQATRDAMQVIRQGTQKSIA